MSKRKTNAKRSSIKLEGFDSLVMKLNEAGKLTTDTAEELINRGADILQRSLVFAMNQQQVTDDLISRLPPPQKTQSGDVYTARAGYIPTPYDPNDLSDFYKAIFINFGTPNRKSHGKDNIEQPRYFIGDAKKVAKHQLDYLEEQMLKKVFKDLK